MRSSKSILAGVAAVALSAGVLTFVGTTSANAAAADAPTIGGTNVVRADVTGGTAAVTITAGAALSAADTYTINGFTRNGLALGAVPAGVTAAGTNLAATTPSAGTILLTASGANTSATLTIANTVAPGKYTAAVATNIGGTASATATITFYVAAGAPAAMGFDETSYDVEVSGTASAALALKDSNANPTYLVAGESLEVTTGSTLVATVTPILVDSASYTQAVATTGYIVETITGVSAGSTSLTAARTSGLTGLANATATVNVAAAPQNALTLEVTQTDDLFNAANDAATATATLTPGAANTAAGTVYVSTAAPTLVFKTTSGAAGATKFAISQNGSTAFPAGVAAATTYVTNGSSVASYAAALTVTSTNPVAGTSYKVTASNSTRNLVWTVVYQAPVIHKITAAPNPVAAVKGGAVSVMATVVDQFQAPVANAPVTYTASGRNTTSGSGATNASGEYAVTYTDAGTNASATSDTVTVNTPAIAATGQAASPVTSATSTVNYYNSIDVAAVTATGNLNDGAAFTTYAGAATTSGEGEILLQANYANTTAGGGTEVTKGQVKLTFTVTSSAGAVSGIPVAVTATEGTYLAAGAGPSLVPVVGVNAKTSLDGYTTSGTYVVQDNFTKTGTATVTASAGGKTATYSVTVKNAAADAHTITVTPATAAVSSKAAALITAKVVDGFGNPVAAVTVTGSATAPGVFGASSSVSGPTNANGTLDVSLTSAGNQTGTSTVVLAGPGTGQLAYTAAQNAAAATILGFGSSANSGTSAVEFTSAPAEKSITIVGARTTVSGKPGIMIDGVTTGIEDGKTVIPYFRFPGQTSYSQGSARPVITDGTFEWKRKTGKKFYAYVTNDDGEVQSNRVIIPAK